MPERDYKRHKERVGAADRAESAAGRDLGKLAKVKNPKRRAKCRTDLLLFLQAYFSARFPIPFSPDHIQVIRRLQAAILTGGQFAFAMPRGSGKTTIVECAAIWAVLFGHRRFAVLIGATEGAATELLDGIKVELETNDLLAEDFPEVCDPIRALEGIANRCRGQTLGGERTRISWTEKQIILPTVKGSAASGAVVRVTGITGRIRGMRHTNAAGESIRPDLVILDDPQTDESAASPAQTARREQILAGAVLGLGGPKKKIAAVMPCTVIYRDDLADRALNRDRHPIWQGERAKLLYALPTNSELWEEYARLRAQGLRAGDAGKAATEFYRRNREAMDAGAIAGWPERFNPDELSAIQHAMNLKIDRPRAFAAEGQNEPESDDPAHGLASLEAADVAARISGVGRGLVPRECTRLTSFIDVHGKLLYWAVCAWDERFGGAVVDYGCYPPQNRPYFALTDARPSLEDLFPKLDEDGRVYAGIKALTGELLGRAFPRDGGGDPLRIDRCLIDTGWKTDVIHDAVRRSPFVAIITPSKGYAIPARGKPMSDWAKPPVGGRAGWNWRLSPNVGGKGRHILFDTFHWKTFAADRLRTPGGSIGGLWLFGDAGTNHQLFADHLAAEAGVPTEGRGRKLVEWSARPDRSDNHWWDCLVGCCVGASLAGLAWSPAAVAGESGAAFTPRAKRVKLSDKQRSRSEPSAPLPPAPSAVPASATAGPKKVKLSDKQRASRRSA